MPVFYFLALKAVERDDFYVRWNFFSYALDTDIKQHAEENSLCFLSRKQLSPVISFVHGEGKRELFGRATYRPVNEIAVG